MTQPVLPILAEKLRAGRPVLAAWVEAAEPAVTEALLREDFDAAVLDMQHGGFDVSKAAAGIGSCALRGKPAIVRVPVGDYATAARMLDAGAAAIIAPMIGSAAEARSFADFVKYPPVGARSWGPGRVTLLSGDDGNPYLEASNARQLAIAMIETADALEAVDDILAVPGIDGVFVGPSDLSIALSRGARVDPNAAEVDAALSRILAAADRAGKFAALFCFSGAKAKVMGQRGFKLLSVATDLLLMRQAARSELAAAR